MVYNACMIKETQKYLKAKKIVLNIIAQKLKIQKKEKRAKQ